ncbi:MAG: hypothetical protein RL685_4792 [Pseudomonadota bacterium]
MGLCQWSAPFHLLVQACASLEDAHQNGLVHRDIKPANIVVSRIGAAWDFVKVLDFGLVKLGSAPQQDEVKLSGEEHVSGTPGFIAPEVVLGAETDQRVDIYALGCVAYWLVTGQLVFDGPGAIKVMSDHIHTAPPPPSTRCHAASGRARSADPRLPGEGACAAPSERTRAAGALAGHPSRPSLDAGARRALVEPSSAGQAQSATDRGRGPLAGGAPAAHGEASAQLTGLDHHEQSHGKRSALLKSLG